MEMGFLSFNLRLLLLVWLGKLVCSQAALRKNQNPLMGIRHIMSNLQFSPGFLHFWRTDNISILLTRGIKKAISPSDKSRELY
jgi:hypothetical protein